ncbi:vitamin K epoxide reductase family protein [Prauserella cavernicola]|uniref:Vitamin K epoxide reductase family protein n=1 Tax=Prauserella cavernicola TaxID=2800127 RepID=A0A934QPB1_9PSEU|nr:vitamin K epoxide reductase family protein [Prauserella cavernicola]MBK1783900.1 vitamin K epoxide reductase family protein [Prauserella cavernicola]
MAGTTAEATAEQSPDTARFVHRVTAWVLTVGGLVGTLAAAALLIEKINSLADPAYVASCSINPVLSCGSAMSTPQAEAFGFPNPVIGVVAFPVVATFGVVLLTGARLPRWCWLGLQAGAVFGIVFVHWLFAQSVYAIGALCPYCLVVWAVMLPVFWYTTVHNLAAGHLRLPSALRPLGRWPVRYHGVVLTTWYLVVIVLIGQAFWWYWSGLFV